MIAGLSAASHPTTALVTGGASGIGLATAHVLGGTESLAWAPLAGGSSNRRRSSL